MTVLSAQAWMPDGMLQADKDALAAAHPDDPHLAAALAWEAWAAAGAGVPAGQQQGSLGATSVSTGAQSVSYADGYGPGPVGEALRRGAWHRSRAKARSVDLAPLYERTSGVLPDDEDRGVIETYDAGTRP